MADDQNPAQESYNPVARIGEDLSETAGSIVSSFVPHFPDPNAPNQDSTKSATLTPEQTRQVAYQVAQQIKNQQAPPPNPDAEDPNVTAVSQAITNFGDTVATKVLGLPDLDQSAPVVPVPTPPPATADISDDSDGETLEELEAVAKETMDVIKGNEQNS